MASGCALPWGCTAGRESTLSWMILPITSQQTGAPAALAAAAVLAYLWAAVGAAGAPSPARAMALTLGWLLHGAWLLLDIVGLGRSDPGVRLGFAPVLSLAVWLMVAVHQVESRFVPLPAVRRSLAVAGLVVVVLAWAFPGELHVMASRWGPLHWVLGVASYGLFGAAVLHATMLDSAERKMRPRAELPAGAAPAAPLGLPLLRLERLTFRFVEAGFVVLTLALVLGFATAAHWRWDHKTVFSMLGWVVFAGLLAGRQLRGWRGQRATRWLYAGTLLLLLAYVGSRFVFEVLLNRGA